MTRIFPPLGILGLLAVASTAAAQGVTVLDTDSARVGVTTGYAGHGVDLEATLDSRVLWDRFRLRASISRGGWDEVYGGFGPRPLVDVTRIGFSVVKFSPPDRSTSARAFAGAGIGVYLPDGRDMRAQLGPFGFVGLDLSRERWTFGPELGVDLPVPRPPRSTAGATPHQIAPTFRVGFGIRRRF